MEQGGGVELHEFHVGDGGPGPVGHGNAVAGGHVRVAGVQVDLAGAAAGQQGDLGGEGHDRIVVDVQDVGAQAAVLLKLAAFDLGGGDQVDGDVVFIDLVYWGAVGPLRPGPARSRGR